MTRSTEDIAGDAPAVEWLPPLVIHDGTYEERTMAQVLLKLTRHVEIINLSTAAGRARYAVIDQGLRDGTMDTRAPPLRLKTKEPA